MFTRRLSVPDSCVIHGCDPCGTADRPNIYAQNLVLGYSFFTNLKCEYTVLCMALRRFAKQITVAVIFFVLLGGLTALLYKATRPEPSCFDGVRGQNEEGIDCGGVCAVACAREPAYKELSAGSAILVPTTESFYDAVADVENKNLDFGASSFNYEFVLLDSASSVVASRSGSSYVLPGEKKFIVEQRLGGAAGVAKVEFRVSGIVWEEVYEYPRIELTIRDRNFSVLPDGASRASGVVVNRTGFDFSQVDVAIVVRDAAGAILGAAKTDAQIIRDGEQRYFETRWPTSFENRVTRVEMEAKTNVFLNANFLERHGIRRPERFQEEVPAMPQERRFRR